MRENVYKCCRYMWHWKCIQWNLLNEMHDFFLHLDLDLDMGTFTLRQSEHPCPSPCPSPWQNCVYLIQGHLRPWLFLVACSSNHVNRRLWACAFHNLGQTPTSVSEEIASCSDKLGHWFPRQKSRTWTRISVNMKHQFNCFDCAWARTWILWPRSQMLCKCALSE